MKNISKTHIYVKIPSLSQNVTIEVNYNEKISELIGRILDNFGIKDNSFFQLYGQNTNFRVIPSNQMCSVLFMSDYDSFVLNCSKTITINVYYMNKIAVIDHDHRAILSDLISVAASCFNLEMGNNNYYVAIDIKSNLILPSNEPINLVDSILIKAVDMYSPGIIFSPNFFPDNGVAGPMLLESLSSFLLTQQLKNLLTLVLSRKKKEFKIVALTKKQMKSIYSAYLKESDLRTIPYEQLNSFLFSILGSYDTPLFPNYIHLMAIQAMKKKSFKKKLEIATIIISYLPLAGYFILLEISQIFGGIPQNEEYRKKHVFLVTDLLFPDSIDKENELRFVAFVLMFYPAVFRIPFTNNVEMRYKNSNLYVVRNSDGKHLIYSDLGPETDVKYEETKSYQFQPQIVELMNKYIKSNEPKTYDLKNEFIKLNEKLDGLSSMFNNYKDKNVRKLFSRKRNESFLPLDPYQYPLKELTLADSSLTPTSELSILNDNVNEKIEKESVGSSERIELGEDSSTRDNSTFFNELENITKHSLKEENLLNNNIRNNLYKDNKFGSIEQIYLDLSDIQFNNTKREEKEKITERGINELNSHEDKNLSKEEQKQESEYEVDEIVEHQEEEQKQELENEENEMNEHQESEYEEDEIAKNQEEEEEHGENEIVEHQEEEEQKQEEEHGEEEMVEYQEEEQKQESEYEEDEIVKHQEEEEQKQESEHGEEEKNEHQESEHEEDEMVEHTEEEQKQESEHEEDEINKHPEEEQKQESEHGEEEMVENHEEEKQESIQHEEEITNHEKDDSTDYSYSNEEESDDI